MGEWVAVWVGGWVGMGMGVGVGVGVGVEWMNGRTGTNERMNDCMK